MFNEDPTPSQSSPSSQSSQPSKQKQSNNMLKEIASESGLGELLGNAHHGLGLFPVCYGTSWYTTRKLICEIDERPS